MEQQKLDRHEFNLYPQMNQTEFKELIESIQKNGFDTLNPIILFEGKIIDGWNRYLASVQAGKRFTTKVFKGNKEDALTFILRANIRRNLTASQKATLASEYLPLLEEAAKARKEAGKKTDSEKGRSTQKAAQLFDTNEKYVEKAKKLKKENPAEFEKVKAGEKSIRQATKKKEEKKKTPKSKTVKIEGAYENAPNNWDKISGVLAVHLDETINFHRSFNAFIPNPGKDFLKLWHEHESVMKKLRSWCIDVAKKCSHCHGTTQVTIDKNGNYDPKGTPAPCNKCMNGFAGEL
ncbi:ParB/RepB/Spo0J family partition protein [Leptospira bandrabouensis]|uniref:ParB/Sulfiredoxin domain-containing protein n=1 Tax=Leptospira bandrabouensis TaxID=2484903 RepID=A0A6H3NNF2_9LEPT|nr:ParB/RepB/Spo0J family partition protein [Leptospira bandrabouensis]TGN13499.1 hypothetical protein EHR08_11625 [Leptospira bandrabouensis]